MNTNEVSPSWDSMDPMPIARGHFTLMPLNNELFAIGGYNGDCTAKVDRWRPGQGWDSVKELPITVMIYLFHKQ